MTDEERLLACKRIENLFMEIMELRLENCELKWQIAKLKKSKKKHKFKFMTVKEYCKKTDCQNCEYCFNTFYDKNRMYKKRNGKYILAEVKE